MLQNFFGKLWQEAYLKNTKNIVSLLETNNQGVALDIGCGDGQKTAVFVKKLKPKTMIGVDGVAQRLEAAKKNGVDTIKTANLEKSWPFRDNHFDSIVSNQVIEHIVDIDHFIQETYRILKPGGYCVISTENLASWHNIFALIMGHQDFSHHLIKKSHIGNPYSLHYKEKTVTWSKEDNSGVDDTAFPHIKIFTFKSLINVFKIYNFSFVSGLGSGYYPLGGFLSFVAAKLDPYHSHFITIKMRKPLRD